MFLLVIFLPHGIAASWNSASESIITCIYISHVCMYVYMCVCVCALSMCMSTHVVIHTALYTSGCVW